MAWVVLLLAGLLEVGWAVGLKYTEGFTRPLPTILTVLGMAASGALLAVAVRTIPLGTGYAVWTGIGAVGTVLLGMVLFGEPASGPRLIFIAIILLSVLGLKLTSPA